MVLPWLVDYKDEDKPTDGGWFYGDNITIHLAHCYLPQPTCLG